jgi:CRP/FNR family transcriptional regulator, cyclic AMP receptor protein
MAAHSAATVDLECAGTEEAGLPAAARQEPLSPMRANPHLTAVRVLEDDPALGTGIDRAEWQAAVAMSAAPEFEFERGPWRFFPAPERGGFGALILAGMIVIRIDAGSRSHLEMLGEGDLISPWVGTGSELSAPSVVAASVVSRARIALLDRGFALRTARWPEIHAAVIGRCIERTRRLSLQSAINALPRIEERVEATLWGLAYRFGRVTPDGIVVDLPISHSQLADIVAAQRPSVSTAIVRLEDQGRIVRTARRTLLLRGEPPAMLSLLARQSGLEP